MFKAELLCSLGDAPEGAWRRLLAEVGENNAELEPLPSRLAFECRRDAHGSVDTCAGDMRWIVCPRTPAPASERRYAT